MPLANPELSENMGLAHFPQPPPIDVQSAARAGWRPLVIVPHTRRSSIRKPGPPPPDRCPPALSQEATEADRGRPYFVGLAVRSLERLATCFGDCQAGNGHRLASERLSPFLDMEGPTRPRRTTSSSKRGPRSDPKDEPRESAIATNAGWPEISSATIPPRPQRCFSPGEPTWRCDRTAIANRLRLGIRPPPSRHWVSGSPSPPSCANPAAAGPGWDFQ